MIWSSRKHARGRRRHLASGLALALWAFVLGGALPVTGTVAQAASSAAPNRFNPTSRASSVEASPPATTTPANARRTGPGHGQPPAAQPAVVALDPALPTHLATSDSKLELDLPAGSVTATDVAAAGGKMSVLVRQVMPASGGTAGGSGHFTFGTFLVQVLDANGALAKQGLRQPLTYRLHYDKVGAAVDVGHTVAVLNRPLPPGFDLSPPGVSSTRATSGPRADLAISPTPALGPSTKQRAAVDPQSRTLSTTASIAGPTASVSFDTVAPVAAFGGPDRFETNLSAGSLTLGYPLTLPSGPGGLTPPLTMTYDSAAVSDQHNPAAAASWVGEGWNLTLGRISWEERDTALGCCPNPDWNDTWQLVDAFGTRAELIPPSFTTSTYYDDLNGTAITPSPIAWHTAPEAHARVISFTGPNALPGMAAVPPCFRVFLPTGLMEEFGCTPDSLQFFPQPTGPNTGLDYVADWLLDMIADPQGNQVHVTYQTDVQTGAAGVSYPRDAVMATVEYDSPGCHNAQAACTGSAWAPLMRVSFQGSHSVAHVAGSSCAANGSLRCDDPVDLSGSGGLAAPTVQSTFVLNDVQVQVRGSPSAGWNTLRDYRLAYDQSGPTTILDPFSGVSESTAGRLNLTQMTEVGADGSTALPTRSFSYTRLTELYEDSVWAPAPVNNCGFPWNVGNGSGCNLWSQSYEGNSYYMSSASNGLGLTQGFVWQNARNNTWGVPSGDLLDPFVCNPPSVQSTSPCDVTDDGSWSRMILTQRSESVLRLSQAGQGGTQTSTPVTSTFTYGYRMAPVDSYWGATFDSDVVDFYNYRFMGFNVVTVGNPDGSREVHTFPATLGRGVFNPSDPMFNGLCTSTNPCNRSPWWDPANATHGREAEVDRYNPDGSLVEVRQTQYQVVCPPTGVAGDQAGNLVSELDADNPLAVCDIGPSRLDRFAVNGGSQSTAPHETTTLAFDALGRVTSATDASNDGGAVGSPTTIVRKLSYTWNDAVSATASSAAGTYLIAYPALVDVEDSSGNRYQCLYTSYDGQPFATGQTSGLTRGAATRSDIYTSCGTAANGFTPSGPISTTRAYNASGDIAGADTPDAVAGSSAHLGCTSGGVTYTACATYDGTFGTLPTSATDALNQRSTTGYQAPAAGTATGGFGLWPISGTDVDGQTTTFTYDALGRETGVTLPGETSGLTTQGAAYTVWCPGTGAQSPCVEIDHTQRLNGSTTVTARAFYDGLGRLVEARSPAPNGKDVVDYSFYDASGRLAFSSDPYLVAAYTGGPGAAAYSIPDTTQAGTTHTYDGVGRLTSTTDPLSHRTTHAYSMVCSPAGTGDSACYEQGLTVDPNGHQSGALIDAMGRTDYEQRYTGSSPSTYALYATGKYTYDFLGNLVQILHPDGATRTTMQYDMAGRETAMSDPDAGTQTYVYDPDGNLVQSVDARGAAGTVFAGYDGLDRPLWHNTTNSPTGAYYTYSYDSTAGGNVGVGRLTGETFSAGGASSLSGSYSFVYDARGREVGQTLTVGSSSYPLRSTFDDAGQVLTHQYPDGETVTNTYTAEGWLSGVSTTQGSTTTNLFSGATYSGVGGAFGHLTGASLGGGAYTYTATDDLLGRAVDRKVTTGGGATMVEQTRTFDAAGNLATESTTLPGGTDNQAFCYDEQNRLTWAGSTGTPPCTGSAIGAGTLTSAQYTQTFAYDTMGRLVSGPLGSYTYGSAAHVHAATAVGSAYTAGYDAAGNMTCRAPSSSATCGGGTPNGAQLGYSNENRLMSWQNAPTSPSSSVQFLYDCQGQRVAQQVTQGGGTSTTVYVGGVEEITTSGATTTTKTYYYAAGRRIAMAVNGTVSYLVADGLGSATVALTASGGALASQLYTPYGAVRYANGTMPTAYGFTGQRADAVSGLDYYHARYYDPVAGQFSSADTVVPGGALSLWGLSRYAYARGNPTSRTDPTGHDDFGDGGGDFSGGDFSGGDFSGGDFTSSDSGSFDTGSVDTGSVDTSGADTSTVDSSGADAGSTDSGSVDSGSADNSTGDSSNVDASSTDSGSQPASTEDPAPSEPEASSDKPAGGDPETKDPETKDPTSDEVKLAANDTGTMSDACAVRAACHQGGPGTTVPPPPVPAPMSPATPFPSTQENSTSTTTTDTARQSDDTTIYRGVDPDHHAYQDALKGIASPGDPLGHTDVDAHNWGFTEDSRMTSWSTDRSVAVGRSGQDGVVLETTIGEVRAAGNPILASPDRFSESEVLVVGTFAGARVTKP